MFYGNYWTAWAGFYDYILNELFEEKIKEHQSFINYLEALKQVHIFIPYKDIVFISDNPTDLLLDDSGRLHAEDLPAMQYSDGYSLFYINGVQVPKWAIETPRAEINPKQVLKLQNTEQRAVLMKYVGLNNFLEELKAEKIHEYEGYKLYYLTIENQTVGPYLYMKCPSSGREFLEGCGNPDKYEFIDTSIKTCEDALKWRATKASNNLMTKYNLRKNWTYSA